jgi:hypothetical protein
MLTGASLPELTLTGFEDELTITRSESLPELASSLSLPNRSEQIELDSSLQCRGVLERGHGFEKLVWRGT